MKKVARMNQNPNLLFFRKNIRFQEDSWLLSLPSNGLLVGLFLVDGDIFVVLNWVALSTKDRSISLLDHKYDELQNPLDINFNHPVLGPILSY